MKDNDAWRTPAGWAALAVGGVVLLAGWYGVQGNSVVAVQMPYFLSGGLGGIAVVLLGIFLLTSADVRSDRSELEALRLSIECLEDELVAMREQLSQQNGNGQKKAPAARKSRSSKAES